MYIVFELCLKARAKFVKCTLEYGRLSSSSCMLKETIPNKWSYRSEFSVNVSGHVQRVSTHFRELEKLYNFAWI